MRPRASSSILIGSAVLLLALAARPAAAQLQFSSPDGKQSFKIGVLGQLQGEILDNTNNTSGKNLFFRRLRILGGYKLGENLSIFFDTDNPNLGKGNPDGTKTAVDVYIQDFVVTYTVAKEFQLDGGEILLPTSYNHMQSAGTLLPVDYGPYTFNESTPTTSRVGRDYGLQGRGYLADDHLEYRIGLYQGARGVGSTNSFRTVGRIAYYVFGPETTFFYRGTSLGKTQTLSLGGSFDVQKKYNSYDLDIFYDQPLNAGDGLTLQGDYMMFDGKTFLPTLHKQKDYLIEAGYYFHDVTLQPFLQYARESFDSNQCAGMPASCELLPSERKLQGGVAYYLAGHNSNLKAAFGRIEPSGGKKRNQLVLQYQVYAF